MTAEVSDFWTGLDRVLALAEEAVRLRALVDEFEAIPGRVVANIHGDDVTDRSWIAAANAIADRMALARSEVMGP